MSSQSDNSTWTTLLSRQMIQAPLVACDDFLTGLKALELPTDRLPTYAELNSRLAKVSDFQVIPVDGLVTPSEFFTMLRNRMFPVVRKIRSSAEHISTYDPDLWHDVFGHVPFLAVPRFSKMYQYFGEIGQKFLDQPGDRWLASIYWYSIEFGLIKTGNSFKVYGSGLMASPLAIKYCLTEEVEKLPFDPETVSKIQFQPGTLQRKLFWIESVETFQEQMRDWAKAKKF